MIPKIAAPISSAQSPVLPMTGHARFLRACHCLPVDRPPVWLMRQAGRALPEYRSLKEGRTFVDLVKTPGLAAEATLQPIERFGFDAAILFSDILTVPEAMGQAYSFREGGGVEMEFPVRSSADVARLDTASVSSRLAYVADALAVVAPRVAASHTALIGFAGSPWTLANYMIEGSSAREWTRARALLHEDPLLFGALMEKITAAVIDLLKLQISAGVDAVQIFDSSGGLLSVADFDQGSARWIRQIIASVGNDVPVIVFSKGAHGVWSTLAGTGANVLGIDWTVDIAAIASGFPAHIAVQGNLDPVLLTTRPDIVAAETRRILSSMRSRPGYIFNLGHGVPPCAKIECIQSLVDTVKAFVS
jgi:uroporphyrinogen decarboxylase